jgi:hypothetical protein
VCDSVNPARLSRAKIQRILTDKPALAALIALGRNVEDSGDTVWQVDEERVARIVLKLARGHMAYELGLPKIELPEKVIFAPLPLLSETERSVFEFPDRGSIALWPEIGSRAFLRAARAQGSPTEDWINIQPANIWHAGLSGISHLRHSRRKLSVLLAPVRCDDTGSPALRFQFEKCNGQILRLHHNSSSVALRGIGAPH